MIYHLPFRDWMELDSKGATPLAAADSEPENGGGDGGERGGR
jgi:beta-lactamase class C